MAEKKWYDNAAAWDHAVRLHHRGQSLTAIAQTGPMGFRVSPSSIKSALIRADEWVGDPMARRKAVAAGKPEWLPALVDNLKARKGHRAWHPNDLHVLMRRIADNLGVTKSTVQTMRKHLKTEGWTYEEGRGWAREEEK